MSAAAATWGHCDTKAMGRGGGGRKTSKGARTAIAALAYRFGMMLKDAITEQVHDYTRRHGVMDKFIVAPEGSPDWVQDPERFANEIERSETKSNSRFARETILALPAELLPQQRRAIALEMAEALRDRYGVAVAVAIHAPDKRGDDRNFHAHLFWTVRELTPDGLGKKTRILDDLKSGPAEFKQIQAIAQDITNRHLAAAGSDTYIDLRSFKERGIDREATIHLGPADSGKERRGQPSEKGEYNREVQQRNDEREALGAEIAVLERDIAAEKERLAAPPKTREDALERLEFSAQRNTETLWRDAAAARSGQPPPAATWWNRVIHGIRQTAQQIAAFFTPRSPDRWQEHEQERERQRSQNYDRGMDL